MKSEPSTFSIDKLIKLKNQTTPWDGVRNYQARNNLKAMKKGEWAFFYHSSCEIPGIVGLVEITEEAYPDPSAFDPKSQYYDPKSTPENPRWFMVNVTFREKFEQPITLAELKKNLTLASMALVQKGNRLSVLRITADHSKTILAMIQ